MNSVRPYHVELLIQEIAKRKLNNSRYSLRAFARFLGIAPSTLSRILSNNQELSLEGSKKIMRKLKFTEEQKITFIASVAEEKKRRAIMLLSKGLENVKTSHDFGFTLEGVVDIALNNFADACIINIIQPDKTLVVHAKHKEELFQNFYEKLNEIKDLATSSCHHYKSCLLTANDDEKGILKGLGASSIIFVPLFADEKLLGTLTLLRPSSRKEFVTKDLALAEDLAVRAILASGAVLDFRG